jgi:phytoene dehydrogenase-like protein
MMSNTDQQEIIVVGAGMAGLVTGAYLARSGLRVTILDQAARVGGRARSRDREGFIFNEGVHALYAGGPASQVLDELQIPHGGGSPNRVFVLDNGRFDRLPATVSLLLRARFLGLRDKIALARFFQMLPTIDPTSLAHLTVEAWLDRATGRPRVRRLLAAFARTTCYSAALDYASAQVFVDRIQLTLQRPVVYVDGGWQTIVDGARRVAEAAGARIETGAQAASVEQSGGRVRAVRLAGGELLSAAAVVLACGPRAASELVDNGEHPQLRGLVESMVPAEVACLDLALSRLPSDRYAAVQDLERPQFLSMQSVCAHIAPAGGAMVQAVRQLPARSRSDPREAEHGLESLLDRAQPGWRDLVVEHVFLPHMEASSLLPAAASGGYGGRPGHRVPGLATLYLAGDWVGPEGYLLDASLASARTTATLVQDDLRSLPESSEDEPMLTMKGGRH